MTLFTYHDARGRSHDYKDYHSYTSARLRSLRSTNGDERFAGYELARCGLVAPGRYCHQDAALAVMQRERASYLIGIELEIEGVYSSEYVRGLDRSEHEANADRIGQALKTYLPQRHVCVSDGSLRSGGCEIVTLPFAPQEYSRVAWYKLLKALRAAGATSYESGRCGLHVSISRKCLPKERWIELKRFINRHKGHFKALSQRETFSYCEFRNDDTKYTALNLKQSVAEFRFFRGNLLPRRFFAAIDTVRSLVDTAIWCDLHNKRIGIREYRLIRARYPLAVKAAESCGVDLTSKREPSGVARRRLTIHERQTRTLSRIRALINRGSDFRCEVYGTLMQLTPMQTSAWAVRSCRCISTAISISDARDRGYSLSVDSSFYRCLPQALQRDLAILERAGIRIDWQLTNVEYPLRSPLVMSGRYRSGGWGRYASLALSFEVRESTATQLIA